MTKTWKKVLSAVVALFLILTCIPGMAYADNGDWKDTEAPQIAALGNAGAEELVGAEDGYTFEMIPSKAGDYHVGDTVTLTAHVTKDGVEVTDLTEAGLYIYFWKDTWTGDYTEEGYDLDNAGNTGRSLTASVTFTAPGEYCVGYNLQDNNWVGIVDNTFMQFSVTDDGDDVEPVMGDIDVERVPGLADDFMMGVDISSIVALYNSGVTFSDWEGNMLPGVDNFIQFLADNGITHVRVRVWNDPYDAEARGYGGGNCDMITAKVIAGFCAEAGIRMLIDFHYSDFWADPGRQTAPKAWTNLGISDKAEALANYTKDALSYIASEGGIIDMVQVGNETTSGIAGESSTGNMCTLFAAGADAVRSFAQREYGDENATKVVIHVTNPEKGNMTRWAKNLSDYNVEYDILATSYYPYWHGTLANLKDQMRSVKDTYGKDVMVAETSYTYTLEDSDGWENTIPNEEAKGANAFYPSTVQGQATAIRNVIAAVSDVGGLGVFYWEPAWITVGDTRGLAGEDLDDRIAANADLWEEFGSGWASHAAASYDANVGPNGELAGGSPIDNEAMFDPFGDPLSSFHVWEYVKTGAETSTLVVDKVDSPQIEVDYTSLLVPAVANALPQTIDVTYSKMSVGTIAEPVSWNGVDLAEIDGVGTYTVHGTVSLSQECSDGTTEVEAACTVIVREANLITDPNVSGFETAAGFVAEGSGIKLASNEDVLAGNRTLHWYNASAVTDKVTTRSAISLEPGWYTLECLAMGMAGENVKVLALDADGTVLAESEPATLTGWTLNPAEFLAPAVTFELEEAADVNLQVVIEVQSGGWGSVDSLYLHKHEHVSDELSTGDGGERIIIHTCDDCGMELGAEEAPADAVIIESATVQFEGQIQLRFTLSVPDALIEDGAAYMTYAKLGINEAIHYRDLTEAGNGKYYLYYPIPIPEFADEVVLRTYDGNGDMYPFISAGGTEYGRNGFRYSVKAYAERMRTNASDETMRKLAQALYDYGAAAQTYFEYTSDFTTDISVSDNVTNVPESALASYKAVTSGTKPAGVTGASIAASFESDNTLRIKFKYDGKHKAADYTYKVDGKTVKSTGSLYVENIAAVDLMDVHTFEISDGTDTYTIEASAMSYARSCVVNGTTERQNLGKAIFLYCLAAKNFFSQG